ncbi:MAG TPA: type II toxin-antitoxin system RelE/ParE family toxin [Allosphingosinicella sp.]|jgi:plasmid stabilization system protein ParE
MKVRFAAAATADLEAIGDYIARDNPGRAASFVGELREACLGLGDFPDRFALVARYERHGVRHRTHGPYLIFYSVGPDEVVVLHILHGAIDYAGLLFPE